MTLFIYTWDVVCKEVIRDLDRGDAIEEKNLRTLRGTVNKSLPNDVTSIVYVRATLIEGLIGNDFGLPVLPSENTQLSVSTQVPPSDNRAVLVDGRVLVK